MNDSVAPEGLESSTVHPDYKIYQQFLVDFNKPRVESGGGGKSHIWFEERKLRERMNEIEKALVGAGAK